MPNAVGIPLILMQCTDELYCVTTMSSFHRPSLTQEGLDLSDALQLLESFKRKKNTIAFRFYFSVLSFVQILIQNLHSVFLTGGTLTVLKHLTSQTSRWRLT